MTMMAEIERPAPDGLQLRRFLRTEDVPLDVARSLLETHAAWMLSLMRAAGGPDFDVTPHVDAFFAGLDRYMPPEGSYYLAYDAEGRVKGTAAMRRMTGARGEMKHLYVLPEARGAGLGRALVEARIADARAMGLKELVADTFEGNAGMIALYRRAGFREVPPFEGCGTAGISPELVGKMLFFRLDLDPA